MQPPYIDAYCHLGLPRFSSAVDALFVAGRSGVRRSVLVLGPDVPDYDALFAAISDYGDRVRGVGIPFGETAAQVQESVDVQLRAGVLGLRLEPRHVTQFSFILDMLGEQGRWIYAISALASAPLISTYIEWLDRYPDARIAAPHFLSPAPGVPEGAARELVQHPCFTPIFSRHGGMGSTLPYPHPDLRAWVEEVVDLSGWQNVMWGSEYPVIYWRNERMSSCQGWLRALVPDLPVTWETAFLRENAQRLIFDQPAPVCEPVAIPAWVTAQFNYDRTLQLFPQGLDIPMTLYADLHRDYLATLRTEDISFADYIVRALTCGHQPDYVLEEENDS